MLKAGRTTQVFMGNPWFLCCAPQTMLNGFQNPPVLGAFSGPAMM